MDYSCKIYARIGELMQGTLSDGRALSLLLGGTDRRLESKRICLRSNIPRGKGLSSSSTDVLIVLSLVNGYLEMGLSAAELYCLAARVEPSDPCLSDDILLFYQQAGVVGRRIGVPPMTLLYFDAAPERAVDTGSVCRPWTPGLGRYYDWLLRRFLRAAEHRCGLMVAHSGTFAGMLVPPERVAGVRARLEVLTGAPVFVEQP
ncbi:MAG TPA: hypothetical protein VHE34_05125 [Puia sp.]|uniref:GHMP family kinase ATP-binding protein n=1 Tax=Puia sp. TaxID=2045100 RepID=UPI002B591C83|nr:hypothetical protein [Puia sp.]HVU94582.1 hypothetical protein [Puia sp.]